jgi:hypothetical protein
MASNGTPRVWRCSVTCVITPPLISPGEPIITRIRPRDPWQLPSRRGRPGPHDRRQPAAVHDQGVTQRLGRGSTEMVKAPPGHCRQDRIAAGRLPQPRVSISESARSGRCGSQPLAFAGDDQPRQFPSSSLPGMTAGRRARGWPAYLRAWMPTWPGVGLPGGGHHREGGRPARRAPMPGLTGWHPPSDLRAPGHGRASCVLRAPIAGPSRLHGG